jgi:hypothetical protein
LNDPVYLIDSFGLFDQRWFSNPNQVIEEAYRNPQAWVFDPSRNIYRTPDYRPASFDDTPCKVLKEVSSFAAGAAVASLTRSPQAGVWAYWGHKSLLSMMDSSPITAPPLPYFQWQSGVEWFNPPSLE